MTPGWWDRLRTRVAGPARFPPPSVPDAESAAAAKDALVRLHREDAARFRRLFLRGAAADPGRWDDATFGSLHAAGLVAPLPAGAWRPCVRVFPFFGAMIATDLLSHDDADQVFSLMFEQVVLVRNLGVRPGDRVLELCLGSGANLVLASAAAGRAVGVDVSPRALAFARFNAALNPGAVPVETVEGSLFAPLAPGDLFDLVLVNPPFEPVPPGAPHFLHSHGGADGLDVVRALLAGAPARLAPGGRFVMFTWSPGDESRVVATDLVRDAFPGHRVEEIRADWARLDDRIGDFRGAPGYAEWRAGLVAAGVTRIWGVLVRAVPAGPGAAPGVVTLNAEREIELARSVSDAWL